jgi:hypothetical protein
VRWNRTVGDHLEYYNFYIRYGCYKDADGSVVIPKYEGDDNEDDCPWIGTRYPLDTQNGDPSFGIASIGRELSNGTRCEFELIYRLSVKDQSFKKKSSCTGKCIIVVFRS